MTKAVRGKQGSARKRSKPRCIVIGGPNGAGKTTFARAYLVQDAAVVHFINADLIASGLSPLRPQLAAAGRLVLSEVERLSAARADFAFESTLSGQGYVQRLKSLKDVGNQIEIIYLRLGSANLALQRVATRVKQGGHDVPARDVRRRFDRSWDNFVAVYKPLADNWVVYDSSTDTPQLVEKG